MDKISIIIPVYNAKEYLSDCVDSILKQSYEAFELLLVDDGSTDGSGMLCDDLARIDKRVTVIHSENEGPSAARNKGIRKASGEYMMFIDSDDFLEEDMLSVLYGLISSKETIDMAACDFFQDGRENKESGENINVSGQACRNELLKNNKVSAYLWNKLFKRSIVKENGILFEPAVHMCEDVLFCMEYLTKCKEVSYVERALYHYVTRDNSISRNTVSERFLTVLTAYEQLIDQLKKEENMELVRLAEAKYAKHVASIAIKLIKNKQHPGRKERLNMVKAKGKKVVYKGLTNKQLAMKYKAGLIILLVYPA